MSIAALLSENPLVLAPLAGYTDLAFRLLCREQGAGICVTEMISCHGLVHEQKNTLVLLNSAPADHPLGVQLFGADPEAMGRAAARISPELADFIDINMGCPVRKVTRKGAGSALMKTPELAGEIIRAVVAHTTLPVTVKFRSGWTQDTITAPDFARMAEQAGAAAVTVHGRTWSQGFSGSADWQVIKTVKQAVSIPVIGNGDVLCHEDSQRMRAQTGCDGVMIGRGALGNPWVFSFAGRPATLSARMPVLRRHLELARKYLPAEKMLFRIKNHLARYLAGLPGASRMRQEIMAASDLTALWTYLEDLQAKA